MLAYRVLRVDQDDELIDHFSDQHDGCGAKQDSLHIDAYKTRLKS